jgi:CHAT domain-containing protein
MNLWQVPDIHMQELMKSFYEQLKEEYKALDALKKARLIMKEKYIQMHTIGAHSYAKEMQILLSTASRYVWALLLGLPMIMYMKKNLKSESVQKQIETF